MEGERKTGVITLVLIVIIFTLELFAVNALLKTEYMKKYIIHFGSVYVGARWISR